MSPPNNSPYHYHYPFANTVIAVVTGLIVCDRFKLMLSTLVTVVAGFLTS